MARPLRVEYPGAMYHVINRGNYRFDVFCSVGAAQAFEAVLDEASGMFGWVVHAYVIMRNHFHLALETPEPNLVDGMHWLQSTYATRFNRFRSENGHIFQGRYQSPLLENPAVLSRVVDYIHLNPVRAKIVSPEMAASFRWSSLRRFQRADCPKWLTATTWMEHLRLAPTTEGWKSYGARLASVADAGDSERKELCHGWAIGTPAWREAVAREHQHLALQRGVSKHEIREMKHARWSAALQSALAKRGESTDSLQCCRKGEPWKCHLALELRQELGVSHVWLAENLHMGSSNSVRAWLHKSKRQISNISA